MRWFRPFKPALVLVTIGLYGCAHKAVKTLPESMASLEIALDNGRASEKPLTPSKTFEVLIKYDPKVPSYAPERLRFLLAQPGHVVFTFYATAENGSPGVELKRLERIYDAAFLSTGKDGKWTVERLNLPVQNGPLWLGISSQPGSDDPRIWSSSIDSEAVFQRDADPTTPLQSTRIRRTPLVRLEIRPILNR